MTEPANGLGGRRVRRRSEIEEITQLTEQFYTTLEAEVAKIEAGGPPAMASVLEEIKALLGKPTKSWSDAYRIEQLLVHLYDDPTMDLELRRRLQEIQDVLGPTLVTWYEARSKDSEAAPSRRALLARLVNDLQWRYMVNEVKRGYSKAVTRSSGWIFVTTLVIFLLWALLPYPMEWMGGGEPSGTHGRPWYLLMLAGFAGAWGASFSMLIGLKKRLDESNVNDLKLMRSLAMLITRPLIGLGAAFILYFFLVAGLVSGGLFPDLAATGGQAGGAETSQGSGETGGAGAASGERAPRGSEPAEGNGTRKDLALLVVLSFLAGFSEKLVPGLLSRTSERISEPRSEAEAARKPPPPGEGGPPAGRPERVGEGGGAGGQEEAEGKPGSEARGGGG